MEALSNAQKAAIIISSIGTENASEVFKHFSDEEVEQITLEIARMNYYPMEVVDRIADGKARVARIIMVDTKFGRIYRSIMEISFSPQIFAASI